MDRAFDQNLTLLIIGIIVPLWCAAVVAFAIIKADNSKVLMLSAVTAAFGDTLASFGERLRRREGQDNSRFDTGVADRD